MSDLVQMRHVTAWRGTTRVFDDLTLDLELGRSTVILGPNGAGKSTFLKLLSREIYPVRKKGSAVRLFGEARWNIWKLRTRLGMVSNDLQTEYPPSTSGSDVVLSGYRSSLGVWRQEFSEGERQRVREVAARLGIGDLMERPYATLSTGEQRRFLLARALVHDPEVLLLDEPTSGLDLSACFRYLAIVRALMKEGKTVVLATHHLHEIPPEIGRAVLLKEGRVMADGEKDAVLTSRALSELFDTPIEVIRANGFIQAVPAAD